MKPDLTERLKRARGFVFDMDGTLVLGDKGHHGYHPLPGALDCLNRLKSAGLPFVVVTSGSAQTPADYAATLRKLGFPVADRMMQTPASVAVDYFTRHKIRRVMVLGSEGASRPLADAGLEPGAVGYLNLHGTATPLNDAMESQAVATLFPHGVGCSSTKALTGHSLGAAGAMEAAFLWLTLSGRWNPDGALPPHLWDGVADPALPVLALAGAGARLPEGTAAALSNSFAFGGSNCCLVLRRGKS